MIDSTRQKSTACLQRKTMRLANESTTTVQEAVGLDADNLQPVLPTPQPSRHPASLFSPSLSLEDWTCDQSEQLATRILDRLQARLPGRIRRLTVCVTKNAVVLAGQCSTYYTKQLAQHTVMGVLEYERLVNNIDVCSLK